MQRVIQFFAERHLLANVLTILIFLMGINSLMNIKRDSFPAVDLDRLTITTRYPGASPEDVELNVTNKLEQELKGVDGLDEMTSYSMENISVINVSLDPDATDTEKIKRDIRDAVGRVTDLPEEVTDAPYIFEVTSDNFEIIYVGVTGEVAYSELRKYATIFEKKLDTIEGISRTDKIGYRDREIQVEVSQNAIDKYQVPMGEIVSAIQHRNIRASGGSFESYTSDKTIVALAQFKDPQEVGDVIVRSTFDGLKIQVKDLAAVIDDFEPEKTRFRMNGQNAIVFMVFKKSAADVIRVVDEIKKMVDLERKNLPEGIDLSYSSDLSRFIKTRLNVLSTNLLIGLALVIGILFIFLDFRTAFWVALGIPIVVMGVFFLSPHFGVYIDLISVLALIMVLGLIVDDAIVVAENISHYRELGNSPLEAAVKGTTGVFKPVFTTILTTCMAFAPFFFMSGMLGKFIYPIPLVIFFALSFSFIEVCFILPAHITAGRRKRTKPMRRNWFEPVREHFQRHIVTVLRLRYFVVLIFVGMLAAAIWYAANFVHFVLFPGNTAEMFYITVELPTGSSLEATTDKISKIEKLIADLPEGEVESFWTKIGSLGGGEWLTPGESENWAFVVVTLTPFSERSRNADQIVENLRKKTDTIDNIDRIRYIIDSGGPPVGRPIALRIVGSDDTRRRTLAAKVVQYLESVQGITDVDRDDKPGKEQVAIKLNYSKLSRLGLTVADIASNVRLAYDGMIVTSVRYGEDDVNFRVILEKKTRQRPGYLGSLKIPNRQNRLIPLNEVASFTTGPGPTSFYHFEGERAITVTADLEEGTELTPLQASKDAIAHFDLNEDWPGMRIIMSGEAEETQNSLISLGIAMLMAGVGIYLVLVLLFNNLTQPIIVMLSIPFGLVGVVAAFALHNEALGFMAMLGIIGMMGVVVNDSLILVAYINFHRKEDPNKKFLRIVAEGTATRLRPILLTSITTVAGLLPTAYGIGGNDPFVAPMALALGYGLLFATPLTLLLLPCLYMVRHDFTKGLNKIAGMKQRKQHQ